MATRDDIVTIARNYLRDFPKFFQTHFTPSALTTTYDLGRPNVDSTSLYVAYIPNGGSASAAASVPVAQYSVDERNGLIRFVPGSPALSGSTVQLEGYHYEWLTKVDMEFYADMAIHLNTHNLDISLAEMAPAVSDVVGIHTLVQALWGLLSEYSRDIDVVSSEAVHIPASQRYRMVSNLLDYWMAEYNRRAQALNIGLERLEMLTLRRISRTTNRLVPIYKAREVGDFGPIERLWPPIDDGVVNIEEEDEELRGDAYIDGDPPQGYLTTGYY